MSEFIRGTFVHCVSKNKLEIFEDYLLGIDASGVISVFEPASTQESIRLATNVPVQTLDSGSFMIPSFCDLHLHAPQFLYQGNGLHLPLMEWLNEYAFKAEGRLDSDPVLARRVYTRLAERLKENGTGAALMFGTIKEETNLILAECFNDAGLRGFIGKLSMDQLSSPSYIEASATSSIERANGFIETMRQTYPPPSLVEPVITPRFVPTCSDTLLCGLGELAASQGVRVQSHLAESHDQVSAVLAEREVDDIDVFQRSRLLTSRTVQAHCTFLDPPSLSRLHAAGTAVAHCPLSNAYFSAEPFRLREALDLDVKVGLGTDVAGGYSLDIMNAMRQAVMVSRMRQGASIMKGEGGSYAIDWVEALYLATRGGAEALGLSSGKFAVGSPLDAQRIALWDATGSGVGDLDFFDEDSKAINMISLEKWWCLGDNRNRTGLWVQGKKL